MIVFGSLLAYSCYEWLIRHAPSSLVGTYAFVNPIVAVLLGWWLLAEPVGPRTLLAATAIVAGVALLVMPARIAVSDSSGTKGQPGSARVPMARILAHGRHSPDHP